MMNRYYPVFNEYVLLIAVLMLSMESAKAQSDTGDSEIVFHIAKKQGCKKKVQQTDLMRECLRGPVKTVITECYNISNFKGLASDGLISTTTDQYNTSGTMTEELIEFKNPNYKITTKRKFDDKGRIISEAMRPSDHHGTDDKEYKYNAAGRLYEVREYGYFYTDNPKAKNRRLPFDFVSKYDSSGNCTREETYNERKTYKYDTNSNCTESVSKVSGEAAVTSVYSYDESCRRITSYQNGSNPMKLTYKYDDTDSLIEMDQALATGDRKTTYEYNADGDRIIEKEVDAAGKVLTNKSYKYLYDVKGNWIQKDDYSFDREERYFIRRITYY